jgi:hypothetical protein
MANPIQEIYDPILRSPAERNYTDDDDPGGTGVGANAGGASSAAAVAAVSSLSAPTTSSSRVPPLISKSMSTETTVMSELELLESTWDFSALHAELDVICPQDNDGVLWCASCHAHAKVMVTRVDAALAH